MQGQTALTGIGCGAGRRCDGGFSGLVAIDQRHTPNGVRWIAAFDLKAVIGGDPRAAVAAGFFWVQKNILAVDATRIMLLFGVPGQGDGFSVDLNIESEIFSISGGGCT